MKKVLIIALAAMCVLSCGQRKAAKSQESEKAACPKENTEAVEHACCGNHGAEGCAAEDVCQTVDKAVKEATATMKKQAEEVKSEVENVEQLGRKADPKPIKPVPKPKK